MKRPPQAPDTQEKRPQPGRLRAIFLAVLVHALFFALIVFGVNWQNAPTAPVQAELWDKLPTAKTTAPPKVEPKPEPPKPEPPKPGPPKPEPPKPEPPKPEPPKPEPPKAKPEPPKPDPAIAEKAEREKRDREKRERLERQREEEARRKQEQEKAEKKKHQEEEAAKKKREQEEAVRRKREDDKRRQEEERTRVAAEQARQAAVEARAREVDQWIQKIKAKILSRANVPDTVPTGTEVSVRIRILPGGDVLSIQVTRSGSPTYSAAIERAIRSAAPLPVPEPNSELFTQFRDLNLNFRHER